MMGRKFENNKLKMAKTALAYAKKASYIGKKVVQAVKAGGSDPTINRQLAAVMNEANALNVPKDVVKKNVQRAEDPDTSDYKELVYEAYAHGGVGLIITCLSDNNNRAAEMVQTACKREACKTAAQGSVAFKFAKVGRLSLRKPIDEDELLELAIEAGCDGDVSIEPAEDDGDGDGGGGGGGVACVVQTDPGEVGVLQAALQAAGYEVSSELAMVPLATVECSAEDVERNYQAIDRLEEIDDVASVAHNMAEGAEADKGGGSPLL